jgi:hypothetical protein
MSPKLIKNARAMLHCQALYEPCKSMVSYCQSKKMCQTKECAFLSSLLDHEMSFLVY